MFKLTFSSVFTSMTFLIASTAIGANFHECCETTFEFRLVVASLINSSSFVMSTADDIVSRISSDLAAARWNDSEMVVGWIPANGWDECGWKVDEPLANIFSA